MPENSPPCQREREGGSLRELAPKTTQKENTHEIDPREAAGRIYDRIERCLADAYAIDLGSKKHFGRRDFDLVTSRTVPTLSAKRGSVATPHDSHIMRALANKIMALVHSRAVTKEGILNQAKELEQIALLKRLPRIGVSPRARGERVWLDWKILCHLGLEHAPTSSLVKHS